jgi:hypothetical protein
MSGDDLLNTNLLSGRPAIRSLFTWPLLIGLVLVDLAFVIVSVVHQSRNGIDLLNPSPWVLEADGGYSEIWSYATEAALVLSLLALAVLARRPIWAGWSALFLAALADDEMRLHESKGAWLAEKLRFPEGVLGLRANDLGEMFVWGLLAAVPLAVVAFFYLRTDRRTRRAGIGLAVLVAAYVFFGGVVDQLHVLFLGGPLENAVGTIEDGGELVVLSLILAYVVALHRRLRSDRRAAASADPAGAPALVGA